MTATNIDLKEFVNALVRVYSSGADYINLDMLADEDNPGMNKLVINPITSSKNEEQRDIFDGILTNPNKIVIRNPNISTDNDDIFNSFKDLL